MFVAVKWLLQQKADRPTAQKFVLACLYNMATRDGVCWPSQSYLANVTGLSERSVRNALKKLADDGEIARRHRRNNDKPTSDLITVRWPREVKELLEDTPHRQNPPAATGTDCRQINQTDNTRHQYQDNRLDDCELFERIPEDGDPYPVQNRVRDLAAPLRNVASNIEWNASGIQNVTILMGWLRRFDFNFVLAVLAQTAAKHRKSEGANKAIKSWQYFVGEIDNEFQKNDQSAYRDSDGKWRKLVEKLTQQKRSA